jgi:hypothetical protein
MGKAIKPRTKAPSPSPYSKDSKHEVMLADAVEFHRQNPSEPWEKIAERFTPLSKDTIRRRFDGGLTKAACGGHNKRLTDEEEKGLINIIDRYTFIGTHL